MLKKLLFSLVCLSLCGCPWDKDENPIDEIFVIDVPHNVCAQRIITDKETLESRPGLESLLIACDGNVSIKYKVWQEIRRKLKKQKQLIEELQKASPVKK